MEIWDIEYVKAAIQKEDPGRGGLDVERVPEGRSRAFTGSHFSHRAGGLGSSQDRDLGGNGGEHLHLHCGQRVL